MFYITLRDALQIKEDLWIEDLKEVLCGPKSLKGLLLTEDLQEVFYEKKGHLQIENLF